MANVIVREASELGLLPGIWPERLLLKNERGTCEEFEKAYSTDDGSAWVYLSGYTTTELHVLND